MIDEMRSCNTTEPNIELTPNELCQNKIEHKSSHTTEPEIELIPFFDNIRPDWSNIYGMVLSEHEGAWEKLSCL